MANHSPFLITRFETLAKPGIPPFHRPMEPETPYSPPTEIGSLPSPAELERKKIFWNRAAWVSFALFVVPPLLGVIGTVNGMRKAFAALGAQGVGDPKILSAAIGEILIATAAGLLFALPAFVFLIISIIRFHSYGARIRQLAA